MPTPLPFTQKIQKCENDSNISSEIIYNIISPEISISHLPSLLGLQLAAAALALSLNQSLLLILIGRYVTRLFS